MRKFRMDFKNSGRVEIEVKDMEKILREILSEDKSLLCRRDELIAVLEKKVPGNLSRDFAPIKKALTLNIGEKFFVGKTNKTAVKKEVEEILKSSGMRADRIDFVIETFAEALDWNTPLVPAERKFIPVTEPVNLAKVETAKTESAEPEEIFNEPEPEPIKNEETVQQENHQQENHQQENYRQENHQQENYQQENYQQENYRQENHPSFPPNHKNKIFTIQGRLNRWAYFLLGLKVVGIMIVGSLLAGISKWLAIPILIASVIGGWMTAIRRMHDLDKSGWWLLISFIPYVNIVFSLYVIFTPGTPSYNRYGADPLTE